MTDDDQSILSTFDAGDTDDVDLSIDEEGYDHEGHREVKAYAKDVTTGGWELVLVKHDYIGWHDPDSYRTYKLERGAAGWHGVYRGRDSSPSYTEDLQDALDGAAEFMAENPVGE